jgi:hypothetical protein
MRLLMVLALTAAVLCGAERTRLLVLTDIGGDPDDQQSMVRLLLYANEFDLEGLVATSRMGHGQDTRPELIRELVDGYAEVHPNLLKHSSMFPDPVHLRSLIKTGQPVPRKVGEDLDTDGSEWIIRAADKHDRRPLWITIWGGATDLAQALWKVSNTRTPEQVRRFVDKLRVAATYDQDQTLAGIRERYASLFLIINSASCRGMYREGDTSLTSREWVRDNVNERHGPLGARYPNYNGGDPWGKVLGVKEGDTPLFLYLLPNGLGVPEEPSWGSWGGRFTRVDRNYFVDAKDTFDGVTNERASVYRWRSAYQADFAARLDWCVKAFSESNHAPVPGGPTLHRMKVKSGETVYLNGGVWKDPDGDELTFSWSDGHRWTAPQVAEATQVHVILTVTDSGTPNLSSYRRVIIEIIPR